MVGSRSHNVDQGEVDRLVLAIMGLLTAVPSLQHARKRAREAKCAKLAESEDKIANGLPSAATDVIDHGNGWREFTLNGNRWLLHSESLALIPKDNNVKFALSFKTPDVLDQVLEDITDEDEREAVEKIASKFLGFGEYIKIEFDTEAGTATVMEK